LQFIAKLCWQFIAKISPDLKQARFSNCAMQPTTDNTAFRRENNKYNFFYEKRGYQPMVFLASQMLEQIYSEEYFKDNNPASFAC